MQTTSLGRRQVLWLEVTKVSALFLGGPVSQRILTPLIALAVKRLSTKGIDMQRFTIILFVFVAGCREQPDTPTAATPQVQRVGEVVGTEGHSANGSQLSETIVGGIVLKPNVAIDGKLSLLLPEDFSEMDEERLKLKYPNELRPTLVYTNKSAAINVAINYTTKRMRRSEIGAFHQQMEGTYRKFHPTATWFHSGVVDIDGRNWIKLDLRTPASDTEIRNIMVGTSVKGRLLLVSFNVTKQLEDQWLEAAEAIIQSLRVRD
ncbi:hypothetical protein [Rosistilla carotiformis]|uniref:hypothetical protein n=1 Tax=Rosistilla carotiformis TaxID=2528017 RepID=UPI0011A75207|nr:hypothetical protein [Rosistilla carotiformis]